jgi:hypothetical protein
VYIRVFLSVACVSNSCLVPLDLADDDDAFTALNKKNLIKQSTCYTLNGVEVDYDACAIILATSGYGRSASADFTNFNAQMNNAPASLIGVII